jgi:spore coat polysaccharide biosynthesis predicted glycosyltransferase SpsG
MILFRADATPQDGLRPLRRCAYLAALLRKSPGTRFACRENRSAARFLAETGLPFVMVKDPAGLDIGGAGAVIFDLADFSGQDAALLAKARERGLKTVQIVPAGEKSQAVDAAFPLAEATNALLHHKFRHFHGARRKYRKGIRNIFVNLGDGLPYRELRGIVDTLHRQRCKMKIAPGAGLKKADKRNLMRIYPGIHFCGKSESPARACFEADLALVPPGEAALEAACVGTPGLYLPLARGEEPRADALAGLGIGVRIPCLADFSLQAVRDAVAALDLETREKMGAAGRALVDGLGVQRFFKMLKENGIIDS